MCIRDRFDIDPFKKKCLLEGLDDIALSLACLLYTSDAADDSLRVDLGGRRIIKNPWLFVF